MRAIEHRPRREQASGRRRASWLTGPWARAALVLALVVAADQLTKRAVERSIVPGEERRLLPGLRRGSAAHRRGRRGRAGPRARAPRGRRPGPARGRARRCRRRRTWRARVSGVRIAYEGGPRRAVDRDAGGALHPACGHSEGTLS